MNNRPGEHSEQPALDIARLQDPGKEALLALLSQPEHTSLLSQLLQSGLRGAEALLLSTTPEDEGDYKRDCAKKLVTAAALCDIEGVIDYNNVISEDAMKYAGVLLLDTMNYLQAFHLLVRRKRDQMKVLDETRRDIDSGVFDLP